MPIKLNVDFFTDKDTGAANRVGKTVNISAGGVYFGTTEWDGLGVSDEVEMRLSGLSAYGMGSLMRTLRGRMTILRVERPDEDAAAPAKACVAARFHGNPCFDVYRWTQ